MSRVSLLACVLAMTATVTSACGAASDVRSHSGPLAPDFTQRTFSSCVPAPNPPDIKTWNTQIGFALNSFVNVSRERLTVESVSLIDPHNLALHGALVYEEAHAQHAMITETAWTLIGHSVPPPDRARIQQVPGAVIPAGFPTDNFKLRYALNLYEIVPDISQMKPGGGWAIGLTVKYRADGTTYTVSAYTGYAIGAPTTNSKYCDAQLAAIHAAFKQGS